MALNLTKSLRSINNKRECTLQIMNSCNLTLQGHMSMKQTDIQRKNKTVQCEH